MMTRKTRFYIERLPYKEGIGLHIGVRWDDGPMSIAKPIEFEQITDRAVATYPAIWLEEIEGQSLMDELWQAGFRPTEGTGSAGMLKATQDHLEDMRKIAFKKLGI